MKTIAISVGDLNGIGIQLILENHHTISQQVQPLYCIDHAMLQQAAQRLNLPIPDNMRCQEKIAEPFTLTPGEVSSKSGHYSFRSFAHAVELARDGKADGIMTLPIHKKAWELAGVTYKGHTDALRDFFKAEAIMMLGCPAMYVALYTEHIPLHQVASHVRNIPKLSNFLIDFYRAIGTHLRNGEQIALLGLNPHAGDEGVLGDEERGIDAARTQAHAILKKNIFTQPLVPDVAFTPNSRKQYRYFVAMYHDQGLAPLKALYFDEGINISLNLPILRASVDHGTAFDIAYQGKQLNNLSYLNAIEYLH